VNWNARAAWINEGQGLDVDRAHKYGLTILYVSARGATKQLIADIQAAGLIAGLYADPSWTPGITAPVFAKQASDWLQTFVPRPWPNEAPPFMADIEVHDPAYVTAFLAEYRRWQPARPSSITVEPFQGGLVPTDEIAARGFHLYPQTFYGDMSPADEAGVLLELTRQGFPAAALHPMYAGERFPARDARDGCVFTIERLP
jgi:hypothetical protein